MATDLTGLGGSRESKDALKNQYWEPPALMAGSGISLTLTEIVNWDDFKSDPNMVYQGSAPRYGLVIAADAETDPSVAGYGFATQAWVLSRATTISGDLVAQIPVSYVTPSVLTIVSGNIVSQIPTIASGYTGAVTFSGSATLTFANGVLTTVA